MEHGTTHAYRKRCKCLECKEITAEKQRERTGYKKRVPAVCGGLTMYKKGCRCPECKQASATYHQSRTYGISQNAVRSLRDIKSCDICGTEVNTHDDNIGCIDHCHETGRVRGMLCRNCNNMLGHARDSVETLSLAIKYLKRPPFNG